MADAVTSPAPPESLSRRERFRRYMRAFNPTAPARDLIKEGLLLPDLHRSLYQAFAVRADLEPGSQQLIIGGIGSGKTTELLMAEDWLSRQAPSIPLYVDITAETDLSDLKSGALLAALGLELIRFIVSKKGASLSEQQETKFKSATKNIQEFALGKKVRVWVEDDYPEYDSDPPDDDDGDSSGHYEWTTISGKLTPPVPRLRKDIQGIRESIRAFLEILAVVENQERDIVALFDGLDRLITPAKFWSVAHQDLRILKELKVSVLATAPLSVLYEDREIAERFDRIHHSAAISTEGMEQLQLRSVLLKRGGDLLLDKKQMLRLCVGSGGVLRDLITLARDVAEVAYIDGENRVRDSHVESAILQLGTSYLRGLSPRQRSRLIAINKSKEFDLTQHVNVELLATRRVLEYSATDFRVHPALMVAIADLAGGEG